MPLVTASPARLRYLRLGLVAVALSLMNALAVTTACAGLPVPPGLNPIDEHTRFYFYFDHEYGTNPWDMYGTNKVATLKECSDARCLIGGSPLLNDNAKPAMTSLCRQGQCLSFDGINDYVRVGSACLLPSADFTLKASVFPRTVVGDVMRKNVVVEKDIYRWQSIIASDDFTLAIDESSSIVVRRGNTTCSGGKVRTNDWNDLAVTYKQAAGALRIYLNGVLQQTCVDHSSIASADIEVGRDYGIASGHFLGLLDDLYLADVVRPIGAAVLAYNFDQAVRSHASVFDTSAHRVDGKYLGGTPMPLQAGRYRNGFRFNGGDGQYIRTIDSDALDVHLQPEFGPAITMETWVRFGIDDQPRVGTRTFFHRGTTTGDDYLWFGIQDGSLQASFLGYSAVPTYDWAPRPERWYHVAATFSIQSGAPFAPSA